MDEEVKIPIKLAVDSSDLEELKQEVSKTFSDIHRYEGKLSGKGDTFKLKGIADMEQTLNGTISNIGTMIQEFNNLRFDTPVKALSDVQSKIDDTNKSIQEEKANIRDINQLLEESRKSIDAAYKRRSRALTAEKKLEDRYKAQQKAIDPSEKGSKSKLKDLEKEYKAQKAIYDDRINKANTVLAADKASRATAVNDLQVAKSRLQSDEEHLDKLREEEAELKTIASSEQLTNQYLAEKKARMKEINAELKKQQEMTYAGSGQARESLETDQAKTGVSSRTKYEEAVYKEKEKAAKEAAKAAEEASKQEQAQINATIQSYNKEAAAIKRSASQYYYKLRAIKMLGFVVNQASTAVDNFGKKAVSSATKALNAYMRLIPGVNAVKKAISSAASGQSKLSKETKNLTKANNGLNLTFGQLIKKLLAYGLGIRSIYMLFRKLRKAISEGFESMAQQVDDVNEKMSSIVTSMNQMKAGITAAVQPLLSVLAPALEKIAAVVAEIAYQVASFIAALTGQSLVYKAARVQMDYAASLDKTGKSAKKAKKELAGFDELNVLHTKDDSGGGDLGGMAWDPVELSQKAKDFADKVKEIFRKLFDPLKKAWDKVGAYVIKSWKDGLLEVKALGASVARDFWKVWEESATQKIFENILFVIADMGQIVGNLARNLRKAWDTARNGYRIFASIRDIVLILSQGLRDAADYTVEWSRHLDFVPAMTHLADAMQSKLVPAVQKVVDLFVILYEQVALKLTKDFIEKALPKMETILGKVAEAIGNIAENVRIAFQSGSNGLGIINNLESLIGIIGDTISDCANKTAEWAKELDFKPLLSSTKNMLKEIEPLISAISGAVGDLWNNTLLPFYKFLIEKGFPKLNDALAEIGGGDWTNFSNTMTSLSQALESFFELAWDVLVEIIKDLGLAFKDFANSDTFASIVQGFKDWVDKADPEKLANKLERLIVEFVALKGVLHLLAKVIMPVITGFMTIQNVFMQGAMTKKVNEIAQSVAKLNGEAVNTANGGILGLVGKFKGLLANLDTVNPQLLTITNTIAGIGAVVGGAILAIANFSDMMVNGFSAGNEAAMLLGIAITAIGAILLGAPALVAGVVAAVVAVVANFVIAIQTMPEEFAKKVNDFGDAIGKIPEKFEAFFSMVLDKVKDFGHNLGVKFGEVIANAPAKFEEWKNKLKVFIANVDWMELGINILKGILYIFSLPARLMVFIVEAVGNFVKSFIDGFKQGMGISSPSKVMEPYGQYVLQGILQGITNALNLVSSTVNRVVNSIKSYFSSGLSASTLVNTGYNLLVGLINGIIDGFNRAYQRVREGCTNIVNIARSIFDIGSPSKVFKEIGGYLMEGMTIGIDDEAKETDAAMADAMDNLIPEPDVNNDFGQTFLDKLTTIKQDAIEIVNSMAEEMQTSMAGLSNIFNFDLTSQMNKLSAVKIPSIAQGQVLPATASFVSGGTQSEQDYSSLANALSSAIVDAITTTSYNRNDSGDTVIQIDGREVFRAVKTQNQLYRKSTGRSAFEG